MCLLYIIDPPVSDGLIDHPQVPAALLIFTVMATVIFLFASIAAIIFSVLLRNHRWAHNFARSRLCGELCNPKLLKKVSFCPVQFYLNASIANYNYKP